MKREIKLLTIFVLIYSICCSIQATEDKQFSQWDKIPVSKNQSGTTNSSLGPFEIYNADSSSSIKLQFAGQLRLTLDNRDNGSNQARTSELNMKARRIRLNLNGTIYSHDLSYKLQLSTAPKSLELIDFYFDYKLKPNLQFRFGQYKTPFTHYRMQSFQRLAFADWAIVTKYFGAERQMGLALHNGYEKPPKWGYVFGIFTGVNARASHAIGLAEVYGEDTVNPSDLVNSGAAGSYHPELFLHFNYNANDIQLNSNSDDEKSGLRYSIGISSAWDLDPADFHDFSFRMAPELLIKYYGLSFVTAGYTGYSQVGNDSEVKLTMTGGLIQTIYRINSSYEISLRYAIVDFENRLLNDASERALKLVDDSENDPDIIEQYKSAGEIFREQEVTLGINIYILGHNLKWQNDFGWLRHSYIQENRIDYQIRSQYQLTF